MHAGAEGVDAAPLQVDGRSMRLLDLLRGSQFTLLVISAADSQPEQVAELATVFMSDWTSATAAPISAWVSTPLSLTAWSGDNLPFEWLIDANGELLKRYGSNQDLIYLIRPDGYVGFRGSAGNRIEWNAYLGRLFGEPDLSTATLNQPQLSGL